jgi:transcription antitermination factor NusG
MPSKGSWEYENVALEPMDLKVHQRVKIIKGPLMDHEGEVVDVKRKTVKVAIDSLGYTLVAYIDRSKLTSTRPG